MAARVDGSSGKRGERPQPGEQAADDLGVVAPFRFGHPLREGDAKDGDAEARAVQTSLMPDGRRLQITVEYAGQAGEESDLLELIRDSWRGIGVALFAKPYQVTVLHNRLFAGDTLMKPTNG